MPSSIYKDMWDTITAGLVWQGEVKNLKKNGQSYWVKSVIEPKISKRWKYNRIFFN